MTLISSARILLKLEVMLGRDGNGHLPSMGCVPLFPMMVFMGAHGCGAAAVPNRVPKRPRREAPANPAPETVPHHLQLTFASPVVAAASTPEAETVLTDEIENIFNETKTLSIFDFLPFSCLTRHVMCTLASVTVCLTVVMLCAARCTHDLSSIADMIQTFICQDVTCEAGVCSRWHSLIGLAVPCLKNKSIVQQLLVLLGRAYTNRTRTFIDGLGPHKFPGLLDYVEYCAGRGTLSRQLIVRGLRGCSLDYIYSNDHDMLSSKGLRMCLEATTSCKAKALHWWGTKCSRFVALCSSKSLRMESNNWEGDVTRHFVYEGNCQALVTSLGVFIGVLAGCLPVLEQPQSSSMPLQRCLRCVFEFFNFQKTVTYAGCFGAASMKPLQLWHLPSTFEGMARSRPSADFFEPLAHRTESGAFTGDKAAVVASEHYTHEFGAAVADIFMTLR